MGRRTLVDRHALIERLGGDRDLAAEMATVLIADFPGTLQRIRRSVTHGSADELREAAHSLKGALLNFLPDGPTATAAQLEQASRTGRMDDAPALLEQLERQVPELIVSLQESLGLE